MAARTTMATLILQVRNMIGDTGGTSNFTDDVIQQVLDTSRVTVRYGLMRLEPTLTTGGVLNYSDYFADVGFWEDSPATQLFGPNYAALTPATTDSITGHWTFALANPGQTPPVFIVGNYFDPYFASAELCQRWAAQIARNYDFRTGAQGFSRSQATKAMRDMAADYRRMSRPKTIPMIRDDEDNGAPWPLGNLTIDGFN